MPADFEEERRSILASTAHLQEDLELSDRDHDAEQAVATGLRDAKAANTRRVYGSAWHEFHGPSQVAVSHCRQSPRQSPST